MSAQPKVFYFYANTKYTSTLKGNETKIEFILKSDYDKLQAKLTEAERLNANLNKQLSEANATLAAVRLTLGRKK